MTKAVALMFVLATVAIDIATACHPTGGGSSDASTSESCATIPVSDTFEGTVRYSGEYHFTKPTIQYLKNENDQCYATVTCEGGNSNYAEIIGTTTETFTWDDWLNEAETMTFASYSYDRADVSFAYENDHYTAYDIYAKKNKNVDQLTCLVYEGAYDPTLLIV